MGLCCWFASFGLINVSQVHMVCSSQQDGAPCPALSLLGSVAGDSAASSNDNLLPQLAYML